MAFDTSILAYALPVFTIWAGYGARRHSNHKRYRAIYDEAQDAGLTDPPSLHPVIDLTRCIGCSSCINACPEGDVLGLFGDKAGLIDPSRCIGHGACKTACPADAISLVFGTATRGVDIPFVDQDFETNVPGIFIAGELAGMGLIRNAIEQGRQAVAAVAERDTIEADSADVLDLLIVGAGPAGISASLAASEAGLRFRTVEQESLGGTVAHFPRNKLVMTEPATLPIYGKLRFREIRKEALLDIWSGIIAETGLEIGFSERVTSVTAATAEGRQFRVETTAGSYLTRHVLLAIGRRGTPPRLDVEGEDLPKVVYRLVDPAQYRGRRVLVVGGGDSALEAALALAEQPDTGVTLCYRGPVFNRARKSNRERTMALAAEQRINVLFGAQVGRITPGSVRVATAAGEQELANDDIIVCTGGVMPTDFIRAMGVAIEEKFGTA